MPESAIYMQPVSNSLLRVYHDRNRECRCYGRNDILPREVCNGKGNSHFPISHENKKGHTVVQFWEWELLDGNGTQAR